MNPRKSKNGFTLAELLISVGIFTAIAAGIIVAMSRGASNVHRGSFNATASNQAAWIVTLMRRDIARSSSEKITLKPDSGTKWTGNGQFTVETNNGRKIRYLIEKRGGGKAFCREEDGSRKTFLASEFIADFSVERSGTALKIEMLLKDPAGKANNFAWNARIYPPVPAGTDRFWKPLSTIK